MIRLTAVALVLSSGTFLACSTSDLETGRTESGIYFEVSGGGAPVILVHGFSLDSRMWDDQEEPRPGG